MKDELRTYCANNKSLVYADTEKRLVVFLDSKSHRRTLSLGTALSNDMEIDFITRMSNIVFRYNPITKELVLFKSRYLNDSHVAIKKEKEYLINLLENPNSLEAMTTVLQGNIFNPHLL